MRESRTMIEPTRGEEEPLIGPDAIMVSMPSVLRVMADLSHAEKKALRIMSPFEFFLVKRDQMPPLSLAGPLLGAPQAVIVMEKLIALGAKKLLVLGWCGSLQPDLMIGDLIIPTTALSEEGTSAHYPMNKKRVQTNSLLNARLGDALEKTNLPFTTGPVWTTDAIYRETEKKVATYRKSGFLAVEMEMSALITVALYRCVELAGLLVVSDELSSLKWHTGFGGDTLKKRSREACKVLLDLCINRE